jgi:hypothetical protein
MRKTTQTENTANRAANTSAFSLLSLRLRPERADPPRGCPGLSQGKATQNANQPLMPRRNQTSNALTQALSHREREREIERELSAGVTDWTPFWYKQRTRRGKAFSLTGFHAPRGRIQALSARQARITLQRNLD